MVDSYNTSYPPELSSEGRGADNPNAQQAGAVQGRTATGEKGAA